MARRRMFSLDIVDSDLFLDMSKTAQLLYFNLGMRADDDGFIQNPKRLLRMLGTDEDDLKLLIAKGFVIHFETGVIVMTHWRQNNYIQKDRYKETLHKAEKQLLNVDENGTYSLKQFECIQDVYNPVYNLDTQVRLGKDRLGKDRLGKGSVVTDEVPDGNNNLYIPKLDDIKTYINDNNYTFNPEYFFNYYKSKDWYIGNKLIENFEQLKSIMDNWQKKENDWQLQKMGNKPQNDRSVIKNSFNNFEKEKLYTDKEISERLRRKGQTCV